jgi:hypothetical protein
MESNVPLIQCRPTKTTLKEPPINRPVHDFATLIDGDHLIPSFRVWSAGANVISLKSEPHHHLALHND